MTGHRRLHDEEALARQVRVVLRRIRDLVPSSPYTSVRFTVVSPLAEGADRLVVQEVLADEQADLEAPLPLPLDEYLHDFASEESRQKFRESLAQATRVVELPHCGSRQDSYAHVGRYVVDKCDVLIALWDGEQSQGRGGTADIVAYAREKRLPVMWIVAKEPHRIVEERVANIGGRPIRDLDAYNRSGISERRFDEELAGQANARLHLSQSAGVKAFVLQALSEWLCPFYVRADLLAERYQRWYYALGNVVFLLAAAAVVAVASQVLFAPEMPGLAWVEVGLLGSLLLIVAMGRRWRLHDRWVSYRFLAERLRSAFFLALAGLQDRREYGRNLDGGQGAEEWLRRAFSEVWSHRPNVEVSGSDVDGIRRYLANVWIDEQVSYHRCQSRKHESRHGQLSRATEALFAITILAAVLHGVGVGGHPSPGTLSWNNLLILVAIGLPAIGAALSGIRAQGEHLRNAERFGRMAHYLQDTMERMEAAADLETVRAIAIEAEDLMLEENRDWLVVMRFHDFELHV